jgi:hypothetical protein
MPDAKVDKLLRTAIRQKRLVKLIYHGKPRIIEPHDYGMLNGTVKLLSYQLAGASRGRLPNWRWIEVDAIAEIDLLQRTFRGGRPTSGGKHHEWDDLYLRVDPPDEEGGEEED